MKTVKKLFLYIFLFVITISASMLTRLPEYFDSYVFYENYKFKAHLCLILYRLTIYLAFPFFVAFVEKLKNKRIKYAYLLVENFNLQFCAYSILSGLYVILGVDKVLDVSLFGVSEIFVFVTGFVFTVMLKKEIPRMVYTDSD